MDKAVFRALMECLADGEFHSGEELGSRLGVSRAAVWKKIQTLTLPGLSIESVKGSGYRIVGGLSLLCADAIKEDLSPDARSVLGGLLCFDQIPSTNQYLLDRDGLCGDVCLSESQSAGRGRRGRNWHSPFGKNLYLSVAWQFNQGVAVLEGLSLAIGVLVVEALQSLGVDGLCLKWPNDILHKQGNVYKKLGGVLIEVGGDLNGDCKVVIGLGLNVSMSDVLIEQDVRVVDQPWCDLKQLGFDGNRNRLSSAILSAFLPALAAYAEEGFAAYRTRWGSFSAFAGRKVLLSSSASVVHGEFLGVDSSGALLLSTESGEQTFSGGELSLRVEP